MRPPRRRSAAATAAPADAGAVRAASLLRLHSLWRRSPPVVLQTESAECGLACLAMVLAWHGVQTDLRLLRQRHAVSVNGMALNALAGAAAAEQLNSRALRLDADELPALRLPCILHWDLGHFVVLVRADSRGVVILDPARGLLRLAPAEVSDRFSGVALELWPAPAFAPRDERQRVPLARLLGRVGGVWALLARVLGMSLALEVFALAAPLLMQWITDWVLVSRDGHLLGVLCLGFALLAIIENGVMLGRGWVLASAAASLKLQWHSNVLAHLLQLPTPWFQKRHLGDVLSRMRSVDAIQNLLTSTFVEAGLDGLMALLALAMMLLYSPALAGVALLGVLIYAGLRLAWYGPLRRAREDQIVREARQSSHLLESLRGVRALKLFGRQRERLEAWQALLADELSESLRVQALTLSARAARGTLSGLFMVLVLWLGAAEVMAGSLSLGMLLAFVAYRSQFNSRVMDLVGRVMDARMVRLDMDRLADIVLSPAEPAAALGQRIPAHADLALRLDAVGFRYADHEAEVLAGISLAISPGELVAITGASGGGKTTLVNLILGDLQPSRGEIRVGGRLLDASVLAAWRQAVGTVLQDDSLFAGSITENVCCFEPRPDMTWLLRCLGAAALADDIARMPMGLHTLVGDMGSSLSGGQKQRLLLARALYKRPRLLLLDEATSHLDVDRELQVMGALARLNITRIVVAHRPETVAAAQRVIELRDGRIAFDGASADWLARRLPLA